MTHRPAAVAVLLATATLLAGCSGAGPKGPDLTGLVDLGGVLVAADKALVAGFVLSDAGLAVPGARVSVLGTDLFTDADARGGFQLVNVTAGDVELQATHPSYKAHVHRLTAPAGQRVLANLTLISLASAGLEAPHQHDHWAGKPTYNLLDREVDLQGPTPGSTYPDAYWTAYGALYRGNSNVTPWEVPIDATPHGGPALVLPGTAQMDVLVTWGSDIVTDGFGLCYDSAAPQSPPVCLGPKPTSPASWSFPVSPAMADAGHQPYSLWHLVLYTRALTQGNGGSPDVTAGSVTVQVLLTKGEVLVDPPHPDFWAAGAERVVLEQSRTSPSACCSAPAEFYPDAIVPPGTTRMRVEHQWSVEGAGGSVPFEFRLAVRTAAMNPHTTPRSGWEQPEVSSGSVAERSVVYEFAVAGDATDGYYQQSSFWRFLAFQPRTGPEGYDLAGVPVVQTLKVTAIRDA